MGLFRRRRQSVLFREAHPWLKLAIRRAIDSGKYSGEQLEALHAALVDKDVLESVFNSTDAIMPTPPKALSNGALAARDWSGFLDALATFVERILPLIMQIIGLFGGTLGVK